MVPLRLNSTLATVALAGALFGGALHLLNFYSMVQFSPWFAGWRVAATLLTHLLFGISAALEYWTLDRRGTDRQR